MVTYTVEIDWAHNGTWTDETSRTRRVQIKSGFDEAGRAVAAVGRCILTMDNGDQRFSPGYVSSPLYGDLLPRRQVRIKADTWTVFRGFVDTIQPDAGEWSAGECLITCVDGIALLKQQRVSVVHEASKAVDDAVSAVVASAYTPPAVSYADNGDLLTHYGRSWLPERTTCLDALREICEAVYGRFYVARDGTPTFWSRDDQQIVGVEKVILLGAKYWQRVKYVLPEALIGYWRMNEGSGTVIGDSSGNGFNGSTHSTGFWGTGIGDGETARGGNGVNNLDEVFSSGLAAAFNATAGSAMCWAKLGNWVTGTFRGLLEFYVDGNNYVSLRKSAADNTLELIYRAGGVTKNATVVMTPDTAWHCLVVTWDKGADVCRFFVDGVELASASGLGTWSGTIVNALIGNSGLGGDGWPGWWAHVALWSRALTPGEVLMLMSGVSSVPVQSLGIGISVATVVNLAQVTVYPVETVGSLADLWKARTVLKVEPGQTRIVMGLFRDANGERVGAVGVVAPVATTDYLVNDDPGGTGFNYTSSPSFSLSTTIEATRAIFTLVNSATGPLYVTLLKIRGKPIRVWDSITVEESDSTSQAAYEVRAVSLDLPMQADEVLAQSYAEYLMTRFKDPFLAADGAVIREESLGGVDVFSLGLMNKILVNEPESGAENLQHWIRGVEYDLAAQNFSVTLHLERADDRQYWQLGRLGFGELGTATRLGF